MIISMNFIKSLQHEVGGKLSIFVKEPLLHFVIAREIHLLPHAVWLQKRR